MKPLFTAIKNGQYEIVNYLINAGTEQFILDETGSNFIENKLDLLCIDDN